MALCVPDASPLIILGKVGQLELLPKLYDGVLITPEVWQETVIKGKAMRAQDAAYLERAARRLRFTKVKMTAGEKGLTERLKNESGIAWADAEVLAVARRRKALAIVDDKEARTVATGLGIAYTGTVGVLYEAFVRKLLSYGELLDVLAKLGRVAWISPELLAEIMRRAREAER